MSECVDCGRKHSPSKHAAHPADSAETLLRDVLEAVDRLIDGPHQPPTWLTSLTALDEARKQARAALQASAPSPAPPDYDGTYHTIRTSAQHAPSPALCAYPRCGFTDAAHPRKAWGDPNHHFFQASTPPAAHPADSAETLLRALGITDETPDYYDRTVGEIRAALQVSDSRVPTDSQRDDLVAACYEENIYSRGDLGMRLEAERLAPSPAADRIEEARRDLWARIGGAAAEGKEPLDVERLERALWKVRFNPERDSSMEWAERIAAAYASQTSEGTE